MGMVKECTNEKCSAYRVKKTYKESDDYCIKCGNMLYHVCKGKKCHTSLRHATEKYCLECAEIRQNRIDNVKRTVGKVGSTTLAVGVFLLDNGEEMIIKGKKIVKQIPKLK